MSKIILQHDERDCGAACFSMIARAYGAKIPLSVARSMTKTDANGTNLYGITDAAGRIGLEANALHGTPEELLAGITDHSITYPFIAHIISEDGFTHYVVVFAKHGSKFVIGDPAKGKVRIETDELISRWTGYIVVFEKKSIVHTEREYHYFRRYSVLIHGQYFRLFLILMLSLIITASALFGAWTLQVATDRMCFDDLIVSEETTDEETLDDGTESVQTEDAEDAEDTEDEEHADEKKGLLRWMSWVWQHTEEFFSRLDVNGLFIVLIILYAFQYVVQLLRATLIVRMSRCIDQKLTLTFLNHVLDIPIEDASRWQTGEYLSRFSDAASIRNAIATVVISFAMDTIMAVACGILLYLIEPSMFGISLVMLLAYAILILCYRKPIKKANRKIMQSNAKVESYFKEVLDGKETIRAANAGDKAKQKSSSLFNTFLNATVKGSFISLSQDTLVSAVESFGTVAILWMGLALIGSGRLSLGDVVSFAVMLGYFTEPVKNLIGLQPTLESASVAAERMNDMLDIEPEKDTASGQHAETEEDSWALEHVDFRYGNHDLTLKNVSLHVKRGETIAIVGESGCGKTTIAKLLLRFYEPEKGAVVAGEKKLGEIALSDVRSAIAFVSQDTFLFSDTVRNNLLLGVENADDDEVLEACRLCRLDELLNRLPRGLDTIMDENGFNLSGGERQRIAIARALLKKPQLLILDEATSNLDTVTENAIQNAIAQITGNMACIMIAHRLSSVKRCDRIYVMRAGEVVGVGNHESLLKENVYYQDLWNY